MTLRFRPWLWLTGLSMLSYLVYIDGIERAWWRWIEFGGFAMILAIEARRRGDGA